MGSKFLSSGGGDLAALQDGSFALNVSSAIIQTLTPSYPVKTSATKELISGLIQLADCAFTPVVPADLAAYLLKAGGTMTGAINMGSQEINNIAAIRPSATNFIAGIGASVTSTANVLLGDSAAIAVARAVGQSVVIGGGGSYATAIESIVVGHASYTEGKYNTLLGNTASITGGGEYNITIGYASGAGSAANNGIAIGHFAAINTNDSVCIGSNSTSSAPANALGSNITNSFAGSLLIAASTNFRANTTTCDLGSIALPFQNMYLSGSIAGPTNTRTVDNIVSNAGASTSGNIASLSGTTGKVITDSGVVAASVVVGPASVITGRVASYDGTTGKLLADSGILAADVVTGPASVTSGNIATYNGTTGKIITNSTAGIGTIGAITLANTTTSTTTGTGALICAGGAGIAGTMTVGGVITMTNATDSASTTSGSLILAGGLGLVKSIFCGGAISASGNVSCNTVNCTRINSTTPPLFSGYASGGFTVGFTAATAKLVDTGTLTQLLDPAGEFTPTASTGRVEYTGATTRYHNVRIIFNIFGNASANTYTAWISKNGSLTQVAARNYNFTAATPAGYLPFEVFGVYQLSTNDTIQLAAQYSATANVNIFDISVEIIPIV